MAEQDPKQKVYFEEIAVADCTCFEPILDGVWGLEKDSNSSSVPSARGGHTATFVPASNQVVVFGGSNREAKFSSDVHLYDVKTRTWTAVDAPSGTGPSARSGHTAVAYKDSVFIYGGMFVKLNERREPQFNFLSDLWRFNVTDKIWSQVGGGEAKPPPKSKKKAKKSMPPPRNEHSAVVVDKTMWVMGGSDEQGPQSTVLAFHLEDSKWEAVGFTGSFPAREMHSAIDYGSKVYVVGGRTREGVDNNFFCFDTEKRAWQHLGAAPSRCGHSAFFFTCAAASLKGEASSSSSSSEGAGKGQGQGQEGARSKKTRRGVTESELRLGIWGGTDGESFYDELLCFAPAVGTGDARTPPPAAKEGGANEGKQEEKAEDKDNDKDKCAHCKGPFGWQRFGPEPPPDEATVAEAAKDKKIPAGRYAHSLTDIGGGEYVLFGGINPDQEFNDTNILKVTSMAQ